jgi:hypothetical protein
VARLSAGETAVARRPKGSLQIKDFGVRATMAWEVLLFRIAGNEPELRNEVFEQQSESFV